MIFLELAIRLFQRIIQKDGVQSGNQGYLGMKSLRLVLVGVFAQPSHHKKNVMEKSHQKRKIPNHMKLPFLIKNTVCDS